MEAPQSAGTQHHTAAEEAPQSAGTQHDTPAEEAPQSAGTQQDTPPVGEDRIKSPTTDKPPVSEVCVYTYGTVLATVPGLSSVTGLYFECLPHAHNENTYGTGKAWN